MLVDWTTIVEHQRAAGTVTVTHKTKKQLQDHEKEEIRAEAHNSSRFSATVQAHMQIAYAKPAEAAGMGAPLTLAEQRSYVGLVQQAAQQQQQQQAAAAAAAGIGSNILLAAQLQQQLFHQAVPGVAGLGAHSQLGSQLGQHEAAAVAAAMSGVNSAVLLAAQLQQQQQLLAAGFQQQWPPLPAVAEAADANTGVPAAGIPAAASLLPGQQVHVHQQLQPSMLQPHAAGSDAGAATSGSGLVFASEQMPPGGTQLGLLAGFAASIDGHAVAAATTGGAATVAGAGSASATTAGRKRRLTEQQSSVPKEMQKKQYTPQRCHQCWNLKKGQKSQHFTWASGKRCPVPCAVCALAMSAHENGPCPQPDA
jgi:hypothetical protein